MMPPVWFCIVICGFSLFGLYTFVRGTMAGSKKVMETVNNLVNTLKDATEIARAYREDLAILRQIAQSGPGQQLGDEPESIIPQPPPAAATMPPPLWSRFTVKPEEPDAATEAIKEVDVTATDEELAAQEADEAAVGFELSERQKAATRDADQARIRELMDYSSAKPEGQ